jgi:hypothetical protein
VGSYLLKAEEEETQKVKELADELLTKHRWITISS